jgi:hypothetical protein
MLRLSAATVVAVAFMAMPAAAGAEGMIQGLWKGELGTIEVTPSAAGGWVGTVVKPAERLCAHPAGRQVWRIDAQVGKRTYTGTDTWVRSLTCEPIGEGASTFELGYTRAGTPRLELCTTNPEQLLDRRCMFFHQPVDELVVRDDDGCTRLRQGQWNVARFEARYLELHTNPQVPQGFPPIELSRRTTDFPLGEVRVGAATCRKKSGRWGIISPAAVHVSSVGLNNDHKPRKKGRQPKLSEGWGIGINASSRSSIEVQFEQCKQGRFWATMKHLNDVPVPGIKYGWDLFKYAGGKFLPDDEIECVDYGVQELKLSVSRRGVLRLRLGYDEPVDQVITSASADGTTYHWNTSVSGPEVVALAR